MPVELVFGIMAIPVFVIAALAYYLGIKGIEDERKAKTRDRKALENELIWNGVWKLVGMDTLTLEKAIRLLEDNRAKDRMPEEERLRKIGLLREYKVAVTNLNKRSRSNWNYDMLHRKDNFEKDIWDDPLPMNELESWMSNSPVGFAHPFKD